MAERAVLVPVWRHDGAKGKLARFHPHTIEVGVEFAIVQIGTDVWHLSSHEIFLSYVRRRKNALANLNTQCGNIILHRSGQPSQPHR